MPVYLLSQSLNFPDPSLATREGLLAVGGDLRPERLLLAYRNGIFPWFGDNDPILWWSPDPRLVLFPGELEVSRSLRKLIRKDVFRCTLDRDFRRVMTECARVRLEKNEPTWIVKDMLEAYCSLHEAGFAHSLEVWHQDRLAGGLYGVALGRCFFGESMFSRMSSASKVALVCLTAHLKEMSFELIDCQVTTRHMIDMGAREISRERFLALLEKAMRAPTLRGKWRLWDGTGPPGTEKHASS